MHLWVFLVANHFRLRLRRTRGIQCSRTWELHQLKCRDCLWWWNTLKKEIPLHTWLLHKSSSVGEDVENVTTSSIHTKSCSWLRKWWCYLYLAIKKTKCSPPPLTHACLHWIYLDHASSSFPCLWFMFWFGCIL